MLRRKCYKYKLVSEAVLLSCNGLNKYAWVKSLLNIRNLKVLLFYLLWVTSSRITYNKHKTWVDVWSFLSNSPILCHMPTICSASVTISWLLFPAYSGLIASPSYTQYSLQPAIHLYFSFFNSCKWFYILLHWTRLEWEKKRTSIWSIFGSTIYVPWAAFIITFIICDPLTSLSAVQGIHIITEWKTSLNLVKAVSEALSLGEKRLGCQLTPDPCQVPGLRMSATIQQCLHMASLHA